VKKLLSVVLTVAIIMVALPMVYSYSLSIYDGFPVEGYYTYNVYESKVTICDVDTSISGDVIIPSTLGGYPVTDIYNGAFRGCSLIESVTIPESVVNIDGFVFQGCYKISTINIPDSVINIGGSAFEDTLWYKNQPDGVIYAGKVAYRYKGNCPKNIKIKEGIIGIGINAFENCAELESIVIPQGAKYINSNAFSGCTSLKEIFVPDSMVYVSDFALTDTAWYNNLSDGPVYLGCMFIDYKGDCPKTVEIKDGTTSITGRGFYDSMELEKVIIPDSVTYIGDSAFGNCINLTDITIPNGVTYIGSYAFYYCTSLETIVIPDSVNQLGEYLFRASSTLKNVTLSKNLKMINTGTFAGCEALESVVIPDGVTRICYRAFQLCENLDNVVIPDSCKVIEDTAFSSCKNLTTISIPKSVEVIEEGAFDNCNAIDTVFYSGDESDKENISINGYNDGLMNAHWYYNACIGSAEHSYDELGRCNICKDTLYVLGDVNGNDSVDTTDLALIKLFLAGINELDETGTLAGDLNEDGDVNTTDLAQLKLKLAGIE